MQDSAQRFTIIDMIDTENRVVMGADVEGEIYKGLPEQNAADTQSSVG